MNRKTAENLSQAGCSAWVYGGGALILAIFKLQDLIMPWFFVMVFVWWYAGQELNGMLTDEEKKARDKAADAYGGFRDPSDMGG